MKGAREYAALFPGNTQVGRLALISGSHARGSTFHIYVLPEGEAMSDSGPGNPPRNKDAVEVYGIVGGQPGWTESYGWLHKGPWQEDFARIVAERKEHLELTKKSRDAATAEKNKAELERVGHLLESYR
jgi:hypothetical protein